MQTADFDHNLFEQGNNDGDKNLLVKFFMKPKQDDAASREEGRAVFKDVEYIDIRVAGKRDPLAVRPATYRDKQRFPRHYDAFKNRVEKPLEGTPLAEWPVITRSQAEELAFINVKTVEQLADMADNHLQRFMGGQTIKQKAKDWLEAAASKAGELKFKELADKAQAENEELKAQLAQQGDLISQLTDRLNALDGAEDEPAAKNKRRRRTSTED